MGFRLVKSEELKLTRELAKQHASMDKTVVERVKRKDLLIYYEGKGRMGLFREFNWARAYCKETSTLYRVDGQHTSIVLSDISEEYFPTEGKVIMKDYECDTFDDVIILFSQFDPRKSSRKITDISRLYQHQHNDIKDLNSYLTKLLIEAVSWQRHTIDGVTVPHGDDVYLLFNEISLHQFLKWAVDTLPIPRSKSKESNVWLFKKGVMAAVYKTFMESQSLSKKFWSEITNTVDIDQTYAPNFLNRRLKEGRDTKIGELYEACMKAWEYFKIGKPMEKIRKKRTKLKL